MRKILKTLLAALAAATLAAGAQTPPVRLGISTFEPLTINTPIIGETIRILQNATAGNITVAQMNLAELERQVKAGNLDIIISSSGFLRRMAIQGIGVKDLATAVSDQAPDPNHAVGSALVVLNSRTDLASVSDLRDKRLAANFSRAFTGYQVGLSAIQDAGYDADRFFSATRFVGHDQQLVLRALERGDADVGIVRSCLLEDTGEDKTLKFRVIAQRRDRLACQHSTRLLPNWTVSTLPSTDPEISRRIASYLLAMPPIEHNLRWSVATDFTGVDQVFRSLRMGPYEYLRQWTLKRFLAEYGLAVLAALALVLGLILHGLRAQALVNRRTRQLEAAHERERRLEAEARETAERIDTIARAGAVSQMSSMIAHELRQPLGAIKAFSYGLLRSFENGRATEKYLTAGLEKISAQATRASDIVEEVRAYAKGRMQRSGMDLAAAARTALDDLEKAKRITVPFEAQVSSHPVPVVANALAIEIVAANLVKNACEAVQAAGRGSIRFFCGERAGSALIEVTNGGGAVSDEEFARITSVLGSSSKPMGLGLGLAIVRSIAESSGGSLEFERPEDGGLTVRVALPLADGSKEEKEHAGQ